MNSRLEIFVHCVAYGGSHTQHALLSSTILGWDADVKTTNM